MHRYLFQERNEKYEVCLGLEISSSSPRSLPDLGNPHIREILILREAPARGYSPHKNNFSVVGHLYGHEDLDVDMWLQHLVEDEKDPINSSCGQIFRMLIIAS